jgi:hypothetical protein
MRYRFAALAAAVLALALPAAGGADDLKGQDRILCTAVQATVCTTDGDCSIEAPWNLNIPQFIEINLKDKTASTTKASGENRSSPLATVSRDDGLIVIQGVEAGRAFSFVITEETGFASIAVARQNLTVSVFGACTPMQGAAAAAGK